MSYQAMKSHGGSLNAYYEVKEAHLRRLQTVQFQSYDIQEKAKLWKQYKDQWLPGVCKEGGINTWGTGGV